MHHAAQLTVPSCAVDPATLLTPCDLAVHPCTGHPSAARPFRPRCHGLVPMQQGAARNGKVSGWLVCPPCTLVRRSPCTPLGRCSPCTLGWCSPCTLGRCSPCTQASWCLPCTLWRCPPCIYHHNNAELSSLLPSPPQFQRGRRARAAQTEMRPEPTTGSMRQQEANHQFGRWGRERRQLGSMATLCQQHHLDVGPVLARFLLVVSILGTGSDFALVRFCTDERFST